MIEETLVWTSGVDNGAYSCMVIRTEPYKGTLTVTRAKDKKVILTREVSIAYDAPFGPDVDDVSAWQDYSITAIDDPEMNK